MIRYTIISYAVFKVHVSQWINTRSMWPQMVVEHNRKSTWRRTLRELIDAPLAGSSGEMMELKGREPTINTPPHLTQPPNGIGKQERFWLEKGMNRVRRYNITWA